jgi:hypothetical protein
LFSDFVVPKHSYTVPYGRRLLTPAFSKGPILLRRIASSKDHSRQGRFGGHTQLTK